MSPLRSPLPSTTESILVVCDNYLLGGRETYIETLLKAMDIVNQQACSASLLASEIDLEAASAIFPNIESVLHSDDLKSWLALGSRLIEQQSVQQIWVHHYALLPALLLALKYQLPMVVSLHGAPLSAGKLSSVDDVLALSLSLQANLTLTAVSQEICDQLKTLGVNKDNITLTPNCVPVNLLNTESVEVEEERSLIKRQVEQSPKQQSSIKKGDTQVAQCVLLTRPQKLNHIRAAVLLVTQLNVQLKTQGMAAHLSVYTGRQLSNNDANNQSNVSKTRLLGRKWLLSHPQVLRFWSNIEIKQPTRYAQRVIADADIVLGMGRVILEGIAANKPSVLIGYDQVVGLVTDEKFHTYQHSNFSGRGVKPEPVRDVAQSLIKSQSDQQPSWKLNKDNQQKISIESSASLWSTIFSSAPVPELDCQQLINLFEDQHSTKEELLKGLHSRLSSPSLRVYNALIKLIH